MYEYWASADTAMTEIRFLEIADLVEWNFTGGEVDRKQDGSLKACLKLSGRYARLGQCELLRKGRGGRCPLRKGLWS